MRALSRTAFAAVVLVLVGAGFGVSFHSDSFPFSTAFAASRSEIEGACRRGSKGACARLGRRAPVELKRIPILQGATDATSTQLALLLPVNGNFQVALFQGEKRLRPVASQSHSRPFSSYGVLQLAYTGLETGIDYRLEVLDRDGQLLDERVLRTLDVRKRKARLALVSCMADRFAAQGEPLWLDLTARQPDVVLFLGDNVYADEGGPADPQKLWNRYAETRVRLAFFRSPRLIPTYATWDDHDYGANDADQSFPHKEAARDVFEAFFPQSPATRTVEHGPGIATSVRLFQQRFFFMDARTFRNEVDSDKIKTHWGQEQNAWLMKQLARGGGPVWLINGSQFFGAYHKHESFEREHPEDLRRLLKNLSALPTPVVFVSGDRHLSEILEVRERDLGAATVELTASGIHSFISRPGDPIEPNPNRRKGPYRDFNYMIVETEAAQGRSAVRLDVSVYGPGGKLGFEDRLILDR